MGGAYTTGSNSFAGTYKVWIIDGVRHTVLVDKWYSFQKGAEIVADFAMEVIGYYIPGLDEVLEELARAYTIGSNMLSFFDDAKSEYVIIEKSFYANRRV